MPLLRKTLEIEIRKITDEDFVDFEGFPRDKEEACLRWSFVFSKYCQTIIPTSTNVEMARQELQLNLMSLNGDPNVFTTALLKFATTLGLGMQPAFTATPPPLSLILTPSTSLGLSGGSAKDVAVSLSTTIDSWFRTGTAINNSSSVIINWN